MDSQFPSNQPQVPNQIPPVQEQMVNQIPSVQEPIPNQRLPIPEQVPNKLTLEQIKGMKQLAKEQAIQQVISQRSYQNQPKVVYVRRNLTIAELLLIFIISSGLVFGVQVGWNVINNYLPRIEIKMN